MPVRRLALGEEPLEDIAAGTTAEERVEMVIELSARMLEFSSEPAPVYERAVRPVRVRRLA